MKARESRLLAVACSQEGYFTAKQAQKAGYDSRLRAYHHKTGAWTRVHRGIYRLTGFPATLEGKYVLWSLWSRGRDGRPRGVLSHETALAIHNGTEPVAGPLHMSVPPSFRRSAEIPRAIKLHKTHIPVDEIEDREGYRVVSKRLASQQVYPERHEPYPIPDTGFMLTGPGRDVIREPAANYADAGRRVLIIAGPNGAGKTTFAREYLPHEASCSTFVNADLIASGLSPFSPDTYAVKAGRMMIREMADHVSHGRSFAIETTMSGQSLVQSIKRWQQNEYAVKIVFLKLQNEELAIRRVVQRVAQGGHNIPEQTIRRRFINGWKNFEEIYRPLADAWALCDNSGSIPQLLDEGGRT